MVQEESCWAGSWKPHWKSFIPFFILSTIAIPASKETACFPSLSNTALRSLKCHRSRIAVMKTCFLKTLPYFVLKEEIFTFKFCQFELRLVNENNADKSAFARVGSKGIDVNESKRLPPTPSAVIWVLGRVAKLGKAEFRPRFCPWLQSEGLQRFSFCRLCSKNEYNMLLEVLTFLEIMPEWCCFYELCSSRSNYAAWSWAK